MTILDGKTLADKILAQVKLEILGFKKKLRLAVVVVGENLIVKKFIAQKKKTAEESGIDFRIYPFAESITTNEFRKRLSEIMHERRNTGVIIQLPLPDHINTQYILNSIVPEKDVDVLSSRAIGNFATGKSAIMPPVAGAIKAFFEEYKIDYKNKFIVIVGVGRLVGKPAILWLLNEKATFAVLEKDSINSKEILKQADIVISGIGSPKFITGDMVKDEVIVLDAGTSESAGKVSGDIDFESVSKKASYITPVPGGIGPVTVAILFKNLIELSKQ